MEANYPESRTYTATEVAERLRAVGLEVVDGKWAERPHGGSRFREDPADLRYFTLTHPESASKLQIFVWEQEQVAGDWILEEVTFENVVYISRWFLRQKSSSVRPADETPLVRTLAQALVVRVEVPLPERCISMPVLRWYHHSRMPGAVSHCGSGTTKVLVSEVQALLDQFVSEVEQLQGV